MFVAHMRFVLGGRSYVRFISQRRAGLMNGPLKCAATHHSGNGEREVRATRLQFVGMKGFEKHGDKMLCDVIACERWKGRGDVARRAVNGRNEDQKE